MPLTFAQPYWLWIGALACAAIALLMVRAERVRRAGLARFAAASPETTLARPRRRLRSGLAVAGVALAFGALARPRAGFRMEHAPHQGVDLMFAVDTSKSMRASDLRPDRLTRAKLAVADLVRKFDGDRVGLIAFAGAAFVQSPLTVDRTVFLEALDALDTEVIPVGGTDIASAIRAAEQAMASEPGHTKVLVLLSDGEDLAGDVVATAKDAARRGLTIYTVGVGSTAGSLIEMTGATGARELVRDEAGNPVTSHLDEPTLRSIAQVTGGAYQPLGADGRGLEALYAIAKTKLPVTTAAGTARKVYTERFQIPLALAFACLLGELALGDRKRRRNARGAVVAASLGLGLFALPRVAAAAPAPAVTTYNDATATYRKGDFAGADRGFEAALHTAEVGVQENAYYDLGNARYREGQATLAKDRDTTIATWKRALEAYDAALALAPADGDAKFNRDYVAKKLDALEQQKKQDQQKQDQQKQDQQNKQQKQDQGGKDQKQPGQQNKDQKAQGQQNKDQKAQGQQNKDQKAQGQQSKDQKAQGQQNKDQQAQGQQNKDQQAQGQQ
ncbi:MAG TPA: VWA domain-containing protein, partial [Kofleriaceae bacterium]|nr:VWA domain-containing protein [Kofleriaceae bacterium]